MKITKMMILKKLEQVMDPELNISIVDLGLIYDVIIEKKRRNQYYYDFNRHRLPIN